MLSLLRRYDGDDFLTFAIKTLGNLNSMTIGWQSGVHSSEKIPEMDSRSINGIGRIRSGERFGKVESEKWKFSIMNRIFKKYSPFPLPRATFLIYHRIARKRQGVNDDTRKFTLWVCVENFSFKKKRPEAMSNHTHMIWTRTAAFVIE